MNDNKQLQILVACEESQRIASAFRKLGCESYSCDLEDCSGGHPEYHIKGDAIRVINGHSLFFTEDGIRHEIKGRWDLIIAHPPCTYLSVAGNRWFNEDRYGKKARQRKMNQEDAVNFFMRFINADCDHIAVENPIGVMSTRYRKPDQIIQPYQFGDPVRKATCLWLKNLPPLKSTEIVEPDLVTFSNGKTMSKWYHEARNLPPKDRSRVRSTTFQGIADAIASQWYDYLKGEYSDDIQTETQTE